MTPTLGNTADGVGLWSAFKKKFNFYMGIYITVSAVLVGLSVMYRSVFQTEPLCKAKILIICFIRVLHKTTSSSIFMLLLGSASEILTWLFRQLVNVRTGR
jgi:hypothetical protein